MKKWPKPNKEFIVPIYGGRVYLFRSNKDFTKAVNFLGHEDASNKTSQGKFQEFVKSDGKVIYLITWNNNKQSTLVHEAAHLTFMILSGVGINCSDSNNETFCYLLDTVCTLLGLDD